MAQLAGAIETAVFEAEIDYALYERTAPDLTLIETPARARANKSLHAGVFKILAFINAAILVVFWATFQGDADALFMVAISAVYLTSYLGTPFLLSRVGGSIDPVERKSFSRFLDEPFETWTGVITGREALLQVVLIPTAILIAVIGMGLIIGVSR